LRLFVARPATLHDSRCATLNALARLFYITSVRDRIFQPTPF
jgi:hypothetical protein